MIVLTGAAGFIGSVILKHLNRQGLDNICIVDDLPYENQFKNLVGKKYDKLFSTKDISLNDSDIDCIIHFGANSSTLEKDWMRIYHSNVVSTRYWYDIAEKNNAKFIFASSAAVYGNGNGPENHYAFSKSISECEIQNSVILRLYNVYGPNEYHKGRMASTIFHWYNQIKSNNNFKIFENSENYKRDFIWVEDVANTVLYFYKNYIPGTYDLGTGRSSSFMDVADAVSFNLNDAEKIFIPMPDDLKKQYQLHTRADINALKNAGIDTESFIDLNTGIRKYIDYLNNRKYI